MEEEFINLKNLPLLDSDLKYLLSIFHNFFNSYYETFTTFGSVKKDSIKKYSWNRKFQDKTSNIFSNIFIVLNKVDLSKYPINYLLDSIISFLELNDILDQRHIKYLTIFINNNGEFFKDTHLFNLLKISLGEYSTGESKYESLSRVCCDVLTRIYPKFKVSEVGLVKRAISKCYDEDNKFPNSLQIVDLLKVTNQETSKIIIEEIEKSLDSNFNYLLYHKLLLTKRYDYRKKDYFLKYAKLVNNYKNGFVKIKNEKPYFRHYVMYNFTLLIYILDIDFDEKELKIFTNLGEFEKWMLHPIKYDYSNFDSRWLIALQDIESVFKKLKTIKPIKECLEEYLRSEYNPDLAKILHIFLT